ncbi:MAG: type II CRISPR RNA-guided endonuclease Cas9 [Candidatus Solibacter usitatus]|nr:type II CRISPR RNA-guided endonuclease Cas9 [Candidatus Solibacter usitatus]
MDYILGIDLGARSIGWAAVQYELGRPMRFLGLGVRVFEAGMEGNLETGREESKAAQRRLARNQRRQTRRRRQRMRLLYGTLQVAGLLPQVVSRPGRPFAAGVQEALNQLDAELRTRYQNEATVHHLPYYLRARALEAALEPYELGRALYHLGQRRGFLSNRKIKAGEDEEKGVVYGGIHKLEAALTDGRTLGQHFAQTDPAAERIRNRYTHRDMYRREFGMICDAQSASRPELTPEIRDRLRDILFNQRPLKSEIDGVEDLVGACEWEPGRKRAPVWTLENQRFRILQSLAHLRVQSPKGAVTSLTEEDRRKLEAVLDTAAELTFAEAKGLLGIPRTWKFTIEEGKESKFRGNVTSARMLEYFGGTWTGLNDEEKSRLLEAIAKARSNEDLASVLVRDWALTEDAARLFSEKFRLPQGYASLSREAMRKAIPFLEKGLSVQNARMAAGYDVVKSVPVHDLLPPVKESGLDIRNPAVIRSLSELRKVVNAVVRKWGKPSEVHIETARELKKSREARSKETSRMRDREKTRENMRARVAEAMGTPTEHVRRKDIEIGLLWDECGGVCPYSGDSLGSFTSLFGGNSAAQVEHIIPRSLCLEDFFDNLTLATRDANARKANRTPFEAFGGNTNEFEAILQRVGAFKGEYARRKLARFVMEAADKQKLLEEFGERHLNDTRYGSRLAAEYVALLYGGEIVDGKRKVLKTTGQITAELRKVWNLNAILSEGPKKSRDDHRHHAVDAAVLAIVSQGYVTKLSSAAERSWSEKKRRYASVEPPWIGFKEELAALVERTIVSHRPDHRVTGALHKDTLYSLRGKNERDGDVRTRRPVHLLKPTEVGRIVDGLVRRQVEEKLKAVGGDAKKLEGDWPQLPCRRGGTVPIKSVRIALTKAVRPIGQGHKTRYAEGSESHHVEVCEVTKGGKRVWRGDVVPMSEALDRLRRGAPVVDRGDQDGRGFVFSLCKDDAVRLSDPNGARSGVWMVRKIKANQQVVLTRNADARTGGRKTDDEAATEKREAFAPSVGGLRAYSPAKVVVTPIGEVTNARD